MIQQSLFDRALENCCPRCGNPEIMSMAEVGDLVSTSSCQFSPDLAEWLTPPQSPLRPESTRRRIALRNSVAFGVSLTIALSLAFYALAGMLPTWPFALPILALACTVGVRTWRSESKLAAEEEALKLETYRELYRAYLNRQEVWSRLRYCGKCSIVLDPTTLQTRSLFEVHELANRPLDGVSLR